MRVVTAQVGWPLQTSPVRPSREYDVTCARTYRGMLGALTDWAGSEHVVLADLGQLGQDDQLACPIKKPSTSGKWLVLSVEQRTVIRVALRDSDTGRAWNSLLKATFKALRRVSSCPWRIGAITAAAPVLLHHEHDWTT